MLVNKSITPHGQKILDLYQPHDFYYHLYKDAISLFYFCYCRTLLDSSNLMGYLILQINYKI